MESNTQGAARPATNLPRWALLSKHGMVVVALAMTPNLTSRQLAEALEPHGITLSPRQVRRHLARLKAGYRRTAQSVSHKQDPAKAERAGRVLAGLKKKRRRAG